MNKSILEESISGSMLVKSDFPRQLDETGSLIYSKFPDDSLQ
jgi:hypothetical protein